MLSCGRNVGNAKSTSFPSACAYTDASFCAIFDFLYSNGYAIRDGAFSSNFGDSFPVDAIPVDSRYRAGRKGKKE